MTYQVALNWDNEAGFADFSKQPSSNGIGAGRRRLAGDGLVYEDGQPSVVLQWGYLTPSEMDTLLGELGLTSAVSNKVTVRIPTNEGRDYANYNGIAVKPDFPSEAPFERTRYTNVRVVIRGLRST